ncbi:TonB-dependent receptor [Chitinivorax sp. PXF-14]|uniref:TonB-dependent receptor plug domain-containing protein n=1 Tax=Chitinivorax sp. PXF-14 TaxID=3230488 RepID=UPI00346710B5
MPSRSLSRHCLTLAPLLGGYLIATPCLAADEATDTPPKLETIQVTGSRLRAIDDRRDATAAKQIYDKEELERFGESTVGAILRRLPGVTYSGNPGRPSEIKMRGMGGGYTQILIDGERVPPRQGRTVSLDMIPVDMIERIEVIRAPVAEYSAQAVAGTINIVLNEDARKKSRGLRAVLNLEHGHAYPQLSGQLGDRAGSLSWQLSGAVLARGQDSLSQRQSEERAADGTLLADSQSQSHRRGHTDELNLSPRLTWRVDEADTLMLQPFIVKSRGSTDGNIEQSQTAGPALPYATAAERTERDTTQARMMASWNHRLGQGEKLLLRVSGNTSQGDDDTRRDERDAAGALLRHVEESQRMRDHGLQASLKWSRPLFDTHLVSTGLEGGQSRRSEHSTQLENGVATGNADGDQFDARERRSALYVQDEWDIDERRALNLGLRWEQLQQSADTGEQRHDNRLSVLSPSLHGVWRFGDGNRQQLRASLARSYKAPGLGDLSPRISTNSNNGPTRPDRTGNPDLKPELAWGTELGVESYFADNSVIGANLFWRRIDELIRRQTSLQDGRWVSRPLNLSNARTAGIELDSKFRLSQLVDGAPEIDFRANYSRFVSKVADIDGPDNRLDDQPDQVLNLGADYRLPGLPLSVGSNFNWTPGYNVRPANNQLNRIDAKRVLDLFATWTIDRGTRLRLTLGNVLANSMDGATRYVLDNGVIRTDLSEDSAYRSASLALEMKL